MMVSGAVLGELIAQFGVLNRLVGRDVTFAGDVGADEGKHVVFLGAFAMERARRVAPLNQRQKGVLAPPALANFVSLLRFESGRHGHPNRP